MSKVKKDDVFCCADCGLEVVVNKSCEFTDANPVCCGRPMIKGRGSSHKTRSSDSEITSGKDHYRRGSM